MDEDEPVLKPKAPKKLPGVPAQPPGMGYQLNGDEWAALIGDDPMKIREMRRKPRLSPRDDLAPTKHGKIHSVLKNQKPCSLCGSPSFFVITTGIACLGCGRSRED